MSLDPLPLWLRPHPLFSCLYSLCPVTPFPVSPEPRQVCCLPPSLCQSWSRSVVPLSVCDKPRSQALVVGVQHLLLEKTLCSLGFTPLLSLGFPPHWQVLQSRLGWSVLFPALLHRGTRCALLGPSLYAHSLGDLIPSPGFEITCILISFSQLLS